MKNIKMLHLVKDEKFIDFFSKKIEEIGGCEHRYIVHMSDPLADMQHISETSIFRKVDDKYFSSSQVVSDLSGYDVLVVHFLTPLAAKLLRNMPGRMKTVWSGWGGDYYYLLAGGEAALLGPVTQGLSRKMTFDKMLKNPIVAARVLLRPFKKKFIMSREILPAIRRIDFFSAPIPEDFYLLKTALGDNFSAEYVQLNYGDFDQTFASVSNDGVQRNILVGNSANLTNNHLEVFKILETLDLDDRKVIVPLSYGNNEYRERVLKYGNEMLGDNFFPILDFMPLTEYKNLVASCSVAIMNQYRQQALGNIGSILYNGSKLFLSRNNITFEFFKKRGAYIFDIEDLTNDQLGRSSELSVEEKERNRAVIESFWGGDKVTSNLEYFLRTLRR